MFAPLYLRTDHVRDMMGSESRNVRTFRRWLDDAVRLELLPEFQKVPRFLELQFARKLVHATRLLRMTRAESRLDALRKAAALSHEELPIINPGDFPGGGSLDQLLYQFSRYEEANYQTNERIEALERQVQELRGGKGAAKR
jgi:hypothetical protein